MFPMDISTAIILIAITIVAIYVYSRSKIRKRLPPGPYGLPIVGYLPYIDPKKPYRTFHELAQKYGPIYGLYLGNVYTVVLSDVKTIRKVLAKDVATGRAPLYLTHGIMKGYGLICAEGDLWKDQRKFAINHLRQFGIVKNNSQRNEKIESLVTEEIVNFLNSIDAANSIDGIDVLEPLRHSIGTIMNRLVLGKVWSSDDATWKWLQHLQEEGTKLIGVAGPLNFLPFLRHVPRFSRTMDFLLDGKHNTHAIYQQIIDEKKRSSKTDDTDPVCNNFVEAFLTERRKRSDDDETSRFYCDQQFHHFLADLFGAGLDTTLATLRWLILYVALDQEHQLKLQDELDVIIGDRKPKIEDFENLPLLEATVSEAQRIRSVVPTGIPHGCLEETVIDGYVVPKNSMIVPLQWSVHMNAKIWPDPNTFDPSRFVDAEGRYVKCEHLMPYQSGKRMCIGDELARIMLLLFSASVFQKYRVALADERVDLDGECGITLTPPEHKLILKRRSEF